MSRPIEAALRAEVKRLRDALAKLSHEASVYAAITTAIRCEEAFADLAAQASAAALAQESEND